MAEGMDREDLLKLAERMRATGTDRLREIEHELTLATRVTEALALLQEREVMLMTVQACTLMQRNLSKPSTS